MSTPRLRGHHMVCLHFFAGEGYSKKFVENLWQVLDRLKEECFLLVEGADDVCDACPSLRDGICTNEPGGEVEMRRLDALAMALLGVDPGAELAFADVYRSLPCALSVWRSRACAGCRFESLCADKVDALADGLDDIFETDGPRT